MDEKSLIKKYQKEISCLQEELTQLKHGVSMSTSNQEDLADRKLQVGVCRYFSCLCSIDFIKH